MEDDFDIDDLLGPEGEDYFEICENCGSGIISEDGVCLFCDTPKKSGKKRRREKVKRDDLPTERLEKVTMYLGLILVILGGPGIATLSYLHDWLRLPFPGPEYDTYAAFGPVNVLVAVVGLIILVIGIFFLVVSLKAGKVTSKIQGRETTL